MPEEGFLCPLCDGTQYEPLLTLRDQMTGTADGRFPLVRCSRCSLLRLYPQPDEETLANAYPSSYAPYTRPGLSGWAKGVLERRAIHQLWERFEPPRRVLDVGCAGGNLLAAVREAGNPEVQGVEPGPRAAQAAARCGLTVFQGTLEEAGFPSDSFDTVVVSHTLEHVPDPLAFLREIQRILRSGGSLLLWLPNADSVEARLLGRYWIGYDAPRHLTSFTTATLGKALARTGFRVVATRHEGVGLEWAWALRLWLGERNPSLGRWLGRLHPALIVLATPLAMVSAARRRSGRIRVIAVKRAGDLPVP
jgi:SAM-dependent methyltransferase